MKKFAIKLTKGDDVTILCVKDTKDEAMKMGEAFKKQYSRESGLLACIEADFYDKNQMTGGNYRLHDVIR